MNSSTIEKIFERFKAAQPHPKTELAYTNPFTLLIAALLSARATDVGVNKATPPLFACADTPEKMMHLGEEKLRAFIKTIGLYQNKAKYIMALSQHLIEKHSGVVPNTREALEALPGVGRKTANVVLNVAFDQPTIAVDTHIFRTSNRIGLAKAKTPEKTEVQLLANIPVCYHDKAHHWLVLHGRYVCKAAKPLCNKCLINDLCEYPLKNFDATKDMHLSGKKKIVP